MSKSRRKHASQPRVFSPADVEKQELWDKYGYEKCDSLAQ